jgi:hypothetical protein
MLPSETHIEKKLRTPLKSTHFTFSLEYPKRRKMRTALDWKPTPAPISVLFGDVSKICALISVSGTRLRKRRRHSDGVSIPSQSYSSSKTSNPGPDYCDLQRTWIVEGRRHHVKCPCIAVSFLLTQPREKIRSIGP